MNEVYSYRRKTPCNHQKDLFTRIIQEHDNTHQPTLCHQAASTGNINALKAYLAFGAPLEKKDLWGYTPLIIASLNGHYECAETLLQHRANIDARGKERNTPLILAVKNRRAPLSKLLLDYNANPNAHNKKKETPFDWAKHNNYPELWQLLSFYGANTHTQQRNAPRLPLTSRPYIHALSSLMDKKNLTFINALKNHRQPIYNPKGTPIGRHENYGSILSLLSEGAQLHITDKSSHGRLNSPLHYAVISRDENLVRTFLTLGANPSAINQDNNTPIDLSVTCPAIFKIFIDCTQSTPLNLWQAITLHKDKQRIKMLLNNNPTLLTKTDPSGNSPYHLTTLASSPNIMKLLLAFKKYNPTQTNNAGKTALQLAKKMSLNTPHNKNGLTTARFKTYSLLRRATQKAYTPARK